MHHAKRFAVEAASILVLCAAFVACAPDERRPIGASCSDRAECVSDLCAGGLCVDPAGDEDGDGLTNAFEDAIGSSLILADTDSDGILDPDELVDLVAVDTDGDGIPDILESAVADADSDCIPDQYDAENEVPNSDLSPMLDVVCSREGICADRPRAEFAVTCPDQETAICDYSGVQGFEDPEVSCDGVDQSCDGVADSGFPDQDGDGAADCVDPDVDGDGVVETVDNCPGIANPTQDDAAGDGIGDACVDLYGFSFAIPPVGPVTAGVPFGVTVTLVDADGAVVERFNGAVTLALADGAPGLLTGETTVNAVAGVAVFEALEVSAPASSLTLVASGGELGEATSPPFDAAPGQFATLRIDGTPASVVAGEAFGVTLTALDAFDHVAVTFEGVVRFAASDPQATLPADAAFTAADEGARAVDGLVLRTAGEQTVSLLDAGTEEVLAAFTVTVEAAAAAALRVETSADEVEAGDALAVTVTALDAFDNVAAGYRGEVALAVDDAEATLPAAAVFGEDDAGARVFEGVVLRTAGARQIAAADTADAAIAGAATVTVTLAEEVALELGGAPAAVVAGDTFGVTVTVRDPFGNLKTDFTGAVELVALSAGGAAVTGATLPAAATFTSGDAGVRAFTGIALTSAEVTTLRARLVSDPGVASDATLAVGHAPAAEFTVSGAPTTVTAGAPFGLEITARDAFGNVASGFDGVVSFGAVGGATLPAPATLAAGVGTYEGLVLTEAGATALVITSGGVAVSWPITVAPAAAATLELSAPPTTVTAGAAIALTATVRDAYGNVATQFTGAATVTTDDPGATPPAVAFDAADAGVVSFDVALVTAGPREIAIDAGGGLAASVDTEVVAAAVASLSVTAGDATVPAGVPTTLVVRALDPWGNLAVGYRGEVGFEAPGDPLATLPADYAFTADDAGERVFGGVTLRTTGEQLIAVTDVDDADLAATTTITVEQGADVVLTLHEVPESVVAGAPFGVVVRVSDPFGNPIVDYAETVAFTAFDAATGQALASATLPADHTFAPAEQGERAFTGLVLTRAAATRLQVRQVDDAAVTTSVVIGVEPADAARVAISEAPSAVVAGAPFSLRVTAFDAYDNVATGFVGPVAFPAIAGATLPTDGTLTAGTRRFEGLALTLAGATSLAVTAGDLDDAIAVDVSPAQADGFEVSALEAALTAGEQRTLTITLRDAYGNTATGGVSGAFSVSGPGVDVAPSSAAIAPGGDGTTDFTATFEQAGERTITVGHPTLGQVTRTTTVAPADAATFEVSAVEAALTAGASRALTVTLRDAFGNVATAGHAAPFTLSAPGVQLPSTLTVGAGGTAQFTATFEQAGDRTITVAHPSLGGGPVLRTTTVAPADAATFEVSALEAALTAGASRALTVTLRDAFGNVATAGHAAPFTLSAPGVQLPSTLTVGAGGTAQFTATFEQAGDRTITVAHPSLGGGPVIRTTTVAPADAATFEVSALEATLTAGASRALTVTLRDAFGNVATAGHAAPFTLSAPGVQLPSTLTVGAGGTAQFTATFEQAGERTITVAHPSLGGGPVLRTTTVAPADAATFEVSALEAALTAGASRALTVTLRDAFGNLATAGHAAPFTLSAPGVQLPATLTVGAGGTAQFTATFEQAGERTITVAHPSLGGGPVLRTTTVAPADAATFEVSALEAALTAGASRALTVTLRDAFGNVATAGHAAPFTLSAPGVQLPSTLTVGAGGTAQFTATFEQAGERTITVAHPSLGGGPVIRTTTVAPADAATFEVSALEAALTAGASRALTVTLRDAFGNLATAGHAAPFTLSAPGVQLPSTLTVGAGGTAQFTATFEQAGERTITVAHPSLGGGPVLRTTTVAPAAPTRLVASDLPPTVTAGDVVAVTAAVHDAYGNVVVNYAGTVTFTSTDAQIVVSPPSPFGFPSGPAERTLAVSFSEAGTQSLELVAPGLADGVVALATDVGAAAAHDLEVAPLTGGAVAGVPFGFTVSLFDAYGNPAVGYTGTVAFQTSAQGATIPASATFVPADAGARAFQATFTRAGTAALTVSDATLAGTSSAQLTRDVSPAPELAALDVVGPATPVTAGAGVTVTVTPRDAWGNPIPDFAASATAAISDPNGTAPTSVALDGVTSVPGFTPRTTGTWALTISADGVDGSTPVTVTPAAPSRLAFSTQPTAGQVNVALPTLAVTAYDAFDNVATTMGPATITLALDRVAGPGDLAGQVDATTASGVATFAAVTLDGPGAGYTLRASATGLPAAVSDRFDVTWRTPSVGASPFVTGGGSCRTLTYTLAQPDGAPADVLVEYQVGAGSWTPATQAPVGTLAGTSGTHALTTSASATTRTFAWDAFTDLGREDLPSVRLRVSARVSGANAWSPARTTGAFAWSGGFDRAYKQIPIASSQIASPGPIVVGDFDKSGRDDVVVLGVGTNAFATFFQDASAGFTETGATLDAPFDPVAATVWRASETDFPRGFLAIEQVDSRFFWVTPQPEGNQIFWQADSLVVCPGGKDNRPVAMAVGDALGDEYLEAFVACVGFGQTPPTISSARQTGASAWSRGTDIALAHRPYAVELADLAHDGRRDLIIGRDEGVTVLRNLGGDGFCASETCGMQQIGVQTPVALAVADLDADGQLDLVTVNKTTDVVVLFGDVTYDEQGNPKTYFSTSPTTLSVSVPANAVTVADVDHDGRLDILLGSDQSDAVTALINVDLAGRAFDERHGFSTGATPGTGPTSLIATDIDGSGSTDLVIGRASAEQRAFGIMSGILRRPCRPVFNAYGVARAQVDPSWTEVADVDGDGRLDAVYASGWDGAVSGLTIAFGDGAGSTTVDPFTYGLDQPATDLAVGDLNGDGRPDVVLLADLPERNVHVLLSDPDLPAGELDLAYVPSDFPPARSPSLVVADLDRDGRDDLAFLRAEGVVAYFQGPSGAFEAAGGQDFTSSGASGLAAADLDLDGYPELVFFRTLSDVDQVCVMRSREARAWHPIAEGDCVPVSGAEGRIRLVDLDGDGSREVVYRTSAGYGQPGVIHVHPQAPLESARLGDPSQVTTCVEARDLRVADVNRDDRLDLLVGCGDGDAAGSAAAIAYRQASNGTFPFQTTFGGTSTQRYAVQVADMTGDHRPDVLLNEAVVRHRPTSSGSFVAPWRVGLPGGTNASYVAVADVDGDTLPDVIVAGGNTFRVTRQLEPGKFAATESYTVSAANFITALAVGHVDTDGRPDIVLGVRASAGNVPRVFIFRQVTSTPGLFTSAPTDDALVPSGASNVTHVVVGDIVPSGAPDILVSSAPFGSTDDFDVFFQAPQFGFTRARANPLDTFPTSVVAIAGGNLGSAFRDVAIAGRCDGTPCVALATLSFNQEFGGYIYAHVVTIPVGMVAGAPLYTTIGGLAVADLDRDGYDDIVVSLGTAAGERVYGVLPQDPVKPGSFLPLRVTEVGSGLPGRLALADVNDDGRLDIVARFNVGQWTAPTSYEVLLGEGDGLDFDTGSALATLERSMFGLGFALADIDRDGRLDLVAVDSNDDVFLIAPAR